MKDAFNFCRSGRSRYVGFTAALRAEITRDASGKRHLEIVNRYAPHHCANPNSIVVFSVSKASVQACKQQANEFLRKAS